MGEFDSNPMLKASISYHTSKALGVSDGTMAGNNGVNDKKREEAALKKTLSPNVSNKKNTSKKDNSGKVICTELHRQGLMSGADYALGADYARAYLTDRHYRGYHAWAIAVVRHMRRSKRATAFWRILAQARADHIAYLYGDTARRNRFGALLCTVGYPACYLIGGFIGERDWRVLYRDDAALHRKQR